MPKNLLIVESPAKAKTIKKYVGDDFEVLASKGHIMDLPKKGGVDHENGFQETYELLEEKGKVEVVKAIRAAAKKVDRVLLAPDPDREGEAIAYHLSTIVKKANKDVEVDRVLFNEITKKGVKEGLEHPRQLDGALYEAQRTRRVLDRIGGYPLSSLLWKKLAFGLSAGRVQTPALRLIVDRQKLHDDFVPQNYWLVDTQLVGDVKPGFHASLVAVNGEKLEKVGSRPAATSEPEAARYVSDLKKAEYRIAKITRKESRRKAPAPYTTSKLQQDASNRLGMQPKRAMRVAQMLYEGISLGRGKNAETVGLITYMRTDSVRVSDDAIKECRAYIETAHGKGAVPEKANVFKTKKQNVQDAHEAIRPTSMEHPPETLEKYLKPDQLKLYRLIWNRFVASQMVPAVYDQTGVDVEAVAGDTTYGLRASGSILKVPGWRAVWGKTAGVLAGEEREEQEVEPGVLPEVSEGETLKVIDPPGVQMHHKMTEPPALFNEASLVKKLEEEGIGRPSTYAEIISKVQRRDYVTKKGNQLHASPLGKLVIEKLVADGFDLADIGFTRKLEESLDAVAESRAKRLDVLAPFHERLQEQIAKATEDKAKWWPDPIELDEECPECKEHKLVERWGRNGPFIGCPGYPDCSYSRNIVQEGDDPDSAKEPELTDYDCQECGSKMLKRWGRNGFFLGCSTYPKCKATRPVPLGYNCPKCKTGDIIEIRARGRGRPFYGCTNYNSDAKCDFRFFQTPYDETCPQCGTNFLVRAGGKSKPVVKCVSGTCDFEREFDEEEENAKLHAAEAEKTKAAEEAKAAEAAKNTGS